MKKKIYITNLPSFYKINLLNGISKYIEIFVVFTNQSSKHRNNNFFEGDKRFKFKSLDKLNIIRKSLYCIKLVKNEKFDELILCGWDQILFWIILFFSPKRLNSIVIESSIHESTVTGFKGFLKKVFLSRISKAYCSGRSQASILDKLNFRGEIVITKGVGLFNIIKQPAYYEVKSVKNFVYVGRFSPEKNVKILINVFNRIPDLNLHLIGFGPQEADLKKIANKTNIFFRGQINNKELPPILQSLDVLLLPSVSEAWGLVVEEAFNNGLPVIVSDKVGCKEEIINENVGFVFPCQNEKILEDKIRCITDVKVFNSMRFNISLMDFEKIADYQIKSYL